MDGAGGPASRGGSFRSTPVSYRPSCSTDPASASACACEGATSAALPHDNLSLRRLVVLAVIPVAIPRRLRERRRSRGKQGRRPPYFAGAVEVVTPMSGWLPSVRVPPPLLDVMPLSSFGDTVVSARPAEQAARMRTVNRAIAVRMVFSLVAFGHSVDSAASRSVVPPAMALSAM